MVHHSIILALKLHDIVDKQQRYDIHVNARNNMITESVRIDPCLCIRPSLPDLVAHYNIHFRAAYRMDYDSFLALTDSLKSHLQKTATAGAVNGVIEPFLRVAVALRYFSGGAILDIMVVHGISHTEAYESVWMVVDAVNHGQLSQTYPLSYPDNREIQHQIALEFSNKSTPKIACCAGAIDGMLIWTDKRTKSECNRVKAGSAKFYCSRKSKYGLNMQAVCDANKKFLDVSILQPASASDYLCLLTSTLHARLEDGLLHKDLVIFGDNAYVNQNYMATPYSNVVAGSKDDYNFYHSQLRINVECSFGVLVNRWRILRHPMSSKISLERTTALVMTLCRIHNWCIDRNLLTIPDQLSTDPMSVIDIDTRNLINPTALLHGGEHFDDTVDLRRQRRRDVNSHLTTLLPRERIHNSLRDLGYIRPDTI
jgi:hypothetical protein